MSLSTWCQSFVPGVCGAGPRHRSASWRRRRLQAPRGTESIETRILLSATSSSDESMTVMVDIGLAGTSSEAKSQFSSVAPSGPSELNAATATSATSAMLGDGINPTVDGGPVGERSNWQ